MSKANYVRGRSTDALLSMSMSEFASLSKAQLRQVVSRLADTANKRIKRLQNSDVESIAARQAAQSGGKFTTRGKGLDELRAEYLREKDFLQSPTSTIKGAREVEREAVKNLKDIYGDDLRGVNIRQMLNDFYKLQEYDEEYQAQKLRYGFLYDQPIEQYGEQEKRDIKRLSRRLIELLNRSVAPGGNSYEGFSQWFNIE